MPARKPKAHPELEPLDALAERVLRMAPEHLVDYQASLSEKDRQLVERAIARKVGAGWRADPLTMGVHFNALQPLAHTAFLARKFVDAVEGRSPRQIWNLPPQHGKSVVGSRFGPVWALDMDPSIKIGLTSYGQSLALENATAVRDMLVEHGDELRARLRRDRRRRDRFVTSEGGGLVAAGVGGALTGFGANGIVVDDPFKNWEEAHSDARRNAVWKWYRSVVRTRLNHRRGIPPFVIVVMTRWHEDDLAGRLVEQDHAGEGEGWELVRLPAVAEDNDLLGRERGEALAPALHSRHELDAIMLSLGSYLSAGLYQQRPEPEEGGEIKRAWFRFESSMPPHYDATLTSWDMKFKDKETGDFVVGQAWGRTGADFWCFDQLRGQWGVSKTKAAIALMAVRHPEITRHVIENTGNGPEIMEELRRSQPQYELADDVRSALGMTDAEAVAVQALVRRGIPGLIPQNVKFDKPTRVRAEAGLIESGNVHLPEGQDWTAVLVNESAAFPTGAHDDCVDTMTQALKRLRIATPTPPSPTNRPPLAKPKASARSVTKVGGPRFGR